MSRYAEALPVCWVLMRLAEGLCLVQWSMALHTALWTGLSYDTYIHNLVGFGVSMYSYATVQE